ncbi:CRISPR-associated endonuclease Cas2 [Leptotrichia sp. OH3620_COT-345]|uniref:CRISPR-associated endonuclease Cas2 n=1 Tax=Leptotrichia sp. OH3620_COT-345 TaxID=2491048 RepID=UPI000F6466CC|nr:CRISPR-associated endonuclease Cas2 [Leptotrichia sp. OH3620_COT-345]RRD39663.1 CRISPR-associated endonuclease Cas2 [Leptotrichia sp. OH3620_COT-345]
MSIKYIGLLMYDFPMQTDIEIKEYNNFRKMIIKKGYYQIQKSIYIMSSNTKERIETTEKQISVMIPKNSSVRTLLLTEEQFRKMKVLSGEITMGELILKNKNRILEY